MSLLSGFTRSHEPAGSKIDPALLGYVLQFGKAQAYLDANPDVAAAGIDASQHWVEWGIGEGRTFPGIEVWSGPISSCPVNSEWVLFNRAGGLIAVRREPPPPPPFCSAFIQFLRDQGGGQAYLAANPDVAAAGIDPYEHWASWGAREGRRFADLEAKRGEGAAVRGPEWREFASQGEPIFVRSRPRLPKSILAQILSQARHDPAVLAPGVNAIARIRQFDAVDLLDRDGVDVPRVFSAIPQRPSAVFVMPFLLSGGAEKYAADLVDAFVERKAGPVLVLVTEHTEKEAEGWKALKILEPLKNVQIVFWRDVCNSFGASSPVALARFLNSLRPRHIVVINSFVGLQAVAQYGRGLSQFARLACAYFSMGMNGLGAPYGVRFPRSTLPFSIALTDNEHMAGTLRRLHGEIPGPGIAVLPARMEPVEDVYFRYRLGGRRKRVGASASKRWAWVSRVETFKGTAVLAELAKLRPTDQFDVFGPAQEDPKALGLDLPNISLKGILPDVAAADFSQHDGFVFTSLFEGMPNVVLEMSQQAIPMALADVGGLRETFDDRAAVFVQHAANARSSADNFSKALDHIASLTADAIELMVTASREQALNLHSPDAYARSAAKLFGLA